MIEVAKKAALEAGKEVMKYFDQKCTSNIKKDGSFVTEADLASEKIILKHLQDNFPTHSIMSEEAGFIDKSSEYCWYIDPIDGTHNFKYGYPTFGISLALAKDKNLILGLIYFPATDELLFAEKGKGAFLNDIKVSVSDRNLNNSVFLARIGRSRKKNNDCFKLLSNHVRDIRVYGASVYNIYCIATGKADLHVAGETKIYDDAASKVIIEEAGGKVTNLDGSKFNSDSNSVISSNAIFHDEIIEILKEVK